jgi:hypothetical protein
VSDDWWVERQQNKRIAGLQEDLSYVSASLSQARASQNRLKAELSKVSGSMEQRLNRLTAAFDAFVEISDLRVTLGLFDVHGRVRHQAKQLLDRGFVGEVADAEGYWLAPALAGLRGVADGAVDADAVDLATARDPLRANTFHALLAAVLGGRPPSLSFPTLPSLPDSVPMYQRAMWLLAADGFFGPGGWELARTQCTTLVSGLTDDKLLDALRSAAVPRTTEQMPKELDGGGDLATVLQACERLTALRTWVTEALDGCKGDPTSAVDPIVRQSLVLLIDEGSQVELPLLARERELRAVIEGKENPLSTWDSPVGSVVELLCADLSAEHPGRRALVARASAPLLLSLGETYAKAARTELPESLTVRTRRGQVTITQDGPDRASLDKALTLVDYASQVEPKRRQAVVGSAVVAVVFVVLMVVAGWGWVFVSLGAAGIGLYQWLTDAKERRKAAEEAVRSKEGLREDVAQRVELFAKTRRELQDRRATVPDDMAALRAALATVAE